jgi:hypothetical protein
MQNRCEFHGPIGQGSMVIVGRYGFWRVPWIERHLEGVGRRVARAKGPKARQIRRMELCNKVARNVALVGLGVTFRKALSC